MVIDASGVKPNITNFELSPRVNLDTNKFDVVNQIQST